MPDEFHVAIKPELTWAFLATQCAISVVCGAIGSCIGSLIALLIVRR